MTDRQQLFIAAYVGRANCNATEAARIAGYAEPKGAGYDLKNDPGVAAEIRRLLEERCMPDMEVLSRLADQARGIGEYVTNGRNGPGVNVKRLTADGRGHLVKSVKPTQFGLSVEFYDAQAALVHIGRNLKLFTDKTESSGPGGGPIEYRDVTAVPDAELDARIAALERGEVPAAARTEPVSAPG